MQGFSKHIAKHNISIPENQTFNVLDINQDAFAYSITNEDTSRCFGSVYIDPSRDESFECEVYFWICKTLEIERAHIQNLLSDWLRHTWRFKQCKIY
ncbi:hypothetical protein [Pseudoalteromonas luteoviolacea]|uniref:Uncharacterized protein n=1 Tax=Pseudoalteromonas luteoviolacea NCIMB 1942 TaxID=1365253 RepID=A0A167AXC7_9GAMM|nr:hypothetical protein [Pseudoalteromonas luteoviolacea]KZN45914.1 hypothetical protein N482_13515 [Pseudoalteromonas luteoviolacea NCIMB 1942]